MKHSIGKLRQKVREVLAMAPGYWLTEKMIVDGVNELIEPDADLSDIRRALEYNVGERYAEGRENTETENREWKVTKAGIARDQF